MKVFGVEIGFGTFDEPVAIPKQIALAFMLTGSGVVRGRNHRWKVGTERNFTRKQLQLQFV
jgi:hypothetical protein